MKFSVSREALLKPLQLVGGVVERRQTLPVLSNVLIVLKGDQLSLTGTDLEVEIVGRIQLETAGQSGEITVPAKKLVDICRSLPDGSNIEFFKKITALLSNPAAAVLPCRLCRQLISLTLKIHLEICVSIALNKKLNV